MAITLVIVAIYAYGAFRLWPWYRWYQAALRADICLRGGFPHCSAFVRLLLEATEQGFSMKSSPSSSSSDDRAKLYFSGGIFQSMRLAWSFRARQCDYDEYAVTKDFPIWLKCLPNEKTQRYPLLFYQLQHLRVRSISPQPGAAETGLSETAHSPPDVVRRILLHINHQATCTLPRLPHACNSDCHFRSSQRAATKVSFLRPYRHHPLFQTSRFVSCQDLEQHSTRLAGTRATISDAKVRP